jgi:sugar (pentulose or hexulose) kinase
MAVPAARTGDQDGTVVVALFGDAVFGARAAGLAREDDFVVRDCFDSVCGGDGG